MDTVVLFGLVGIVLTKVIDLLRNAFDKNDRIPKAYINIAAFVLGIGAAALICSVDAVRTFAHLPADATCRDFVLQGLGFGAVSSFWHELLSALSARSGPAATPKGLIPGPKV